MSRVSRRLVTALGCASALLFLDQVTKVLVKGLSLPWLGIHVSGMRLGESIPVIGQWFNITYIENPNMAFGLEFGGKLYLSLFALAASIGIIWYLIKHPTLHAGIRYGLSFILAGALGNMLDRTLHGWWYHDWPLFTGNVVDFFDFDLGVIALGGSQFKLWPVFNVADIAVSVGVILLMLFSRHLPSSRSQLSEGSEEPGEPRKDVENNPIHE